MQGHLLAVENLLTPAPRHADEILEHRAFDAPGILHAHHRQGKQVLIDARRCESIGGPDLAALLAGGPHGSPPRNGLLTVGRPASPSFCNASTHMRRAWS